MHLLKNQMTLLLLLILGLSTQLEAQRKVARATWGDFRKYDSFDDCQEWYLTTIGSDSYMFSVENYGATGLIALADHNFFLRKEGPNAGADFPLLPELDNASYLNHFLRGNILTVFYSARPQGEEEHQLFAFQLNIESKDQPTPVKLGDGYYGPRLPRGKVEIEQSDAGQFILVTRKRTDDKENRLHEFIGLDADLSLLWRYEESFVTYKEVFNVRKAFITEGGDALIVARKSFDGSSLNGGVNVKNGEPNFEYILVSITDKGANFQVDRLYKEENFLIDLGGYYKDGIIYLTGFYSNVLRNSLSSVKGLYQLQVDPVNFEYLSENYVNLGEQITEKYR
ncbi:MAG: hypothetical protein KDC44_14600, partial [Phaeodactylibacter sp.]|nr:hypothetical protein [Phaeodactylibacter sp.]